MFWNATVNVAVSMGENDDAGIPLVFGPGKNEGQA
jgi:hypothetical protein